MSALRRVAAYLSAILAIALCVVIVPFRAPGDGATAASSAAQAMRGAAACSASNMAHPAAHGGMLMPGASSCASFRAPISMKGWTASASSSVKGHPASAVLSGGTRTWWQSRSGKRGKPFPAQTLTLRTAKSTVVTGLQYVARRGQASIGQFEVRLSADGRRFGPIVAKGRWQQGSSTKQVSWNPTKIRAVQIVIRSASPSGSTSVSAATVNLTGTQPAAQQGMPVPGTNSNPAPATPAAPAAPAAPVAPVAPVAGNPAAAIVGSWGPTIAFPLVPVAVASIPGNKLVVWAADENMAFGQTSAAATQTAVLDLNTGAVSATRVTNTGHNMFCPGVSLLADGRVLVTGGISNAETSIYDPRTDSWSAGPRMNIGRGYQSQTTLSNGGVFTIGGSWSGGVGGKLGEIYFPNGGWRALSGTSTDPMVTADNGGIYRSDNHAWLVASSNGTVLQAGPSKQMNWISTTGDGAMVPAGTRGNAGDQMNGNAVLFDVNKVLTVGGASSYQNVDATAAAHVLDLSGGYGQPVAVTQTGALAHPRSYANSVVLPDGSVLTLGGMSHPVPFSDAGSVLTPELWNPVSGTWTGMADAAEPRNYHSIATLLPDGTVFSGGGGLCGNTCGTNHPTGQIFSPPYLFAKDGSPAARPTIANVPPAANPGDNIAVTAGGGATQFVLVRAGSSTHSVDTDQRRVPLAVRSQNGGAFTLAIPGDSGVVLPGRYMLFALTAAGVPSISAPLTINVAP